MRAKKSNEQKRAKSPEDDERATPIEETEAGERAVLAEKTAFGERADATEKTLAVERAALDKKPVSKERAEHKEKPEIEERAGRAEKSETKERAAGSKKTAMVERASDRENPIEGERAVGHEKAIRDGRAAASEETANKERAVEREKPAERERAVLVKKTGADERAGPTKETGEEKRAALGEETVYPERSAPLPSVGPSTPRGAAPSPSSWALVRRLADSYDDVQRLRIAVGNRLVKLGRNEQVADSHASVLVALSEDLARHEESMAAAMRAEVHGHIMGDWLVAHRGIAEQSAATIIATLERRPHWSGCRAPKVKDRCDTPPDGFDAWDGAGQPFCRHSTWIDPKHPSSFWKFCGLYPGARRERGKTSEFNAYARVRMYRIATNMIRSGNEEYGAIYRQAKQRYLQYPMIHGKGPDDSGHALYADLMARRVMIKQFLVDLHVEWTKRLGLPPSEPYSARIHRGETPQTPPEFAAGVSA